MTPITAICWFAALTRTRLACTTGGSPAWRVTAHETVRTVGTPLFNDDGVATGGPTEGTAIAQTLAPMNHKVTRATRWILQIEEIIACVLLAHSGSRPEDV